VVLREGVAALRKIPGFSEIALFTEAHRTIFRSIRRLDRRDDPVDILTVQAELARTHELAGVGGPQALAALVEHSDLAIMAHLPSYAAVVCAQAQRREYHALGLRLANANGAGPAELATMVREAEALARVVAPPDPETLPMEATEFLEHRFPPRPDLVARGVLPRAGFLVVNGRPKVHKSMLCDNLMLQRARGAAWLGFPTDPGITLAIQAEHSPVSWQERLRTMTAHDPEPLPTGRLFLKTLRGGAYINWPEGLDAITRLLDDTGADCLRLDPLSRYMVGNENSNGDDGMGGVVRAIDKILARGVAVILVHHQGKPSKDDPRTGGLSLRGGSALFGAADTVITVERDDDAVLLSFELRHGRAPEPLRLAVTDDQWLVPSGANPDLLRVAQLVGTAPLPYKTLWQAAEQDLRLSERTAKRRIADAIKAGLLEKDDDGLYRVGPRCHAVPDDA
jgi:hypothetical protein